jgi:hypothetical protein
MYLEKDDMIVCDKCRIVGIQADRYSVGVRKYEQSDGTASSYPLIQEGNRRIPLPIDLCEKCAGEFRVQIMDIVSVIKGRQ